MNELQLVVRCCSDVYHWVKRHFHLVDRLRSVIHFRFSHCAAWRRYPLTFHMYRLIIPRKQSPFFSGPQESAAPHCVMPRALVSKTLPPQVLIFNLEPYLPLSLLSLDHDVLSRAALCKYQEGNCKGIVLSECCRVAAESFLRVSGTVLACSAARGGHLDQFERPAPAIAVQRCSKTC